MADHPDGDATGGAPTVNLSAPPSGAAAGTRQAPTVDHTAPPSGAAAGTRQAPTVDARPAGGGRGRVPADTDPVPLATLAEPARRYWSGVEISRAGAVRVVEATDTLLGRAVAMREPIDADPEALRRFVRETKLAARLEHAAIAPVYDAGTADDGAPYCVTRTVTGRSLDELVRAAPDLHARLALVPHVVAAAQALAHAHARGIVHRDVTPAHIVVDDHGETVVADWSLAKIADEATADAPPLPALTVQLASDAARTPGMSGFTSPEQLRGAEVDARSDVYALGATLYYVLAGEAPPAARAGMSPPRVRGVPAELAAIADTALAYDERGRYPHAGSLADALARFVRDRLVATRRYSARAIGAIGAAAVVLAIAGVVALRHVVAARDAARDEARAADTALRRETARADELVLGEARLIVDRDPTAAIALVRPLAEGPHWREVHAIAAAAQATGVAWRMAGPAYAISVAISPDGVHAASLGSDGEVRVYDLAARTTRELLKLDGAMTSLEMLDAGRIVAWGPTARVLRMIQVASGVGREVPIAAVPRMFAAARGDAFWSDADGHGWRLDPLGAPTRLPVDDPLHAIAPSPDGTRVIACGEHGLWMISAGPAVRVFDRETYAAAWNEAGTYIAAVADGEILGTALDAPGPCATSRSPGGRRSRSWAARSSARTSTASRWTTTSSTRRAACCCRSCPPATRSRSRSRMTARSRCSRRSNHRS